jgi:SulP family sulfate permease
LKPSSRLRQEWLGNVRGDKNRECMGQGIANVATGFIGNMAGCAMIGQSVINVKSGGRGRLSTMIAGVVLLMLVVFGAPWVRQIPMARWIAWSSSSAVKGSRSRWWG